jgi:hypothetical protein
MRIETKGDILPKQESFEIISAGELEAQTKEMAQEVKEVLNLPNTALTILLLRRYQYTYTHKYTQTNTFSQCIN